MAFCGGRSPMGVRSLRMRGTRCGANAEEAQKLEDPDLHIDVFVPMWLYSLWSDGCKRASGARCMVFIRYAEAVSRTNAMKFQTSIPAKPFSLSDRPNWFRQSTDLVRYLRYFKHDFLNLIENFLDMFSLRWHYENN